jgi:methionine-rich copper-binding protein CopC
MAKFCPTHGEWWYAHRVGETERRFTFHRDRWPTGPIMFGLAMALGIAAFMIPDRAASAEPVLLQSTPANDARLLVAPTRLTFRFNVPIRRFAVAVTRDGEALQTADPIRGAGPDEAFVELLPGQDGFYRVTWEAYGQDASLTQGTLVFRVGGPQPPVSTEVPPTVGTAPETPEQPATTTSPAPTGASPTATGPTPASTTLSTSASASTEPPPTDKPTTTRRPTTTKPRSASSTTTIAPTTSTSIPTASVMTTSPKPTGTSQSGAEPDPATATANRPLPGSAELPGVPSGPAVYPRTGRDRSASSTTTSTTTASSVGNSTANETPSDAESSRTEKSTRPPKALDQPTATALSIPIRGVPTTSGTTGEASPDTLGTGTSLTSTTIAPSAVASDVATNPPSTVRTIDAEPRRNLGMGRLRTLLAGLGLASVLTAFGAWFARPTGARLRRTLLLFTSLVAALVLALVGFGVLAERKALPHDRGLLSIKIVGGALLLLAVLLRAIIARRIGRRQMAAPRGPRILLNEVGFAGMSLVVTALLMAR